MKTREPLKRVIEAAVLVTSSPTLLRDPRVRWLAGALGGLYEAIDCWPQERGALARAERRREAAEEGRPLLGPADPEVSEQVSGVSEEDGGFR